MSDKTVLVVDGSESERSLIRQELLEAGYRVVEAAEGGAALARIAEMECPPDLIVLEAALADMDGLELCRKLNGRPDRGGSIVPVVMVTKDVVGEEEGFRERLGIFGVMGKPFEPGAVRYRVDSILQAGENFEGMRALIAEDAPVVRRIVRGALERIGMEVVEVSDGLAALKLMAEQDQLFDIVITDYRMPNMLGDEFCRRLKTYRRMSNVPIFFISSEDDMEAVIGFFRAGASDYLKKPFVLEEFRARVVTHLKVRKYVREMQVMNEKLHKLATTDELTGVYNRRFFEENLKILFRSSQACGGELCCLMFDLDRFKNINDSRGHMFGDYVLREFGAILLKHGRLEDVVARYGGEEFIMLLPGMGLRKAHERADEIRADVEHRLYSYDGNTARVTCSVGISSLTDHEPPIAEKLTAMADDALYTAKESGRNRVAVYMADKK